MHLPTAKGAHDELATLFAHQHGVITVAQALEWVERSYIRTALRHRRWMRPHPRVLITHNAALSELQRCWLAVLAAPDGSALCGPTAAGLDGLRGFEDDRVHIVIPKGQRPVLLSGVVCHESRRLDEIDVHPHREPRRTRLPRSIVDLASSATQSSTASAVVLAAMQQRLVRPAEIRDVLERRGRCRHRRDIVDACLDFDGGVHSVPESQFNRIVRGRGLPAPTRQAVRIRKNGQTYYLDADWPEFSTSAEVDGAPHRDVVHWTRDLDRMSEVMAEGTRVLRFTSFSVRQEPQRVGDLLERSLRTGGWQS